MKYTICDYHQLLMEYGNNQETNFLFFHEWCEKQGLKYKVQTKIFDNFDKAFNYCMELTCLLNENIGFQIIKIYEGEN